jgi:uncharacterized membrane protein
MFQAICLPIFRILLTVFFASFNVEAAGRYAVTSLGEVAGRSSMSRALNSAGHVAGRSGTPANTGTTASLWIGGQLQVLGVLPGGDFSEAAGLNDSDEVVGSSNTSSQLRPIRWTRSTGLQDLGALSGDVGGQAFAINRAGTAVGFSTGASGHSRCYLEQELRCTEPRRNGGRKVEPGVSH